MDCLNCAQNSADICCDCWDDIRRQLVEAQHSYALALKQNGDLIEQCTELRHQLAGARADYEDMAVHDIALMEETNRARQQRDAAHETLRRIGLLTDSGALDLWECRTANCAGIAVVEGLCGLCARSVLTAQHTQPTKPQGADRQKGR